MGSMGAEFWLPALLGGGLSASQSLFGGVDDPQTLASFARRPGDYLDPRLQLEQLSRDRAQLQGIMAARAAAPVDIPGAFVQPIGVRAGGGLPGPVGVTSQDPALFNPQQYLYRPGAQFAQPDWNDPELREWANPDRYESRNVTDIATGLTDEGGRTSAAPLQAKRWFGGEYVPRYTSPQFEGDVDEKGFDIRPTRQRFTGLDQPQIPGTPTVGGGIPRLMANLELLGVTEDPVTGVLGMDESAVGPVANPDLFQGSGFTNPRGGVPADEVAGAPAGQPLLGTYDQGTRRRLAPNQDYTETTDAEQARRNWRKRIHDPAGPNPDPGPGEA
jgi:hypothetical protein